jgi:hypothetical protein
MAVGGSKTEVLTLRMIFSRFSELFAKAYIMTIGMAM